jgi:hypothetical protein
MEIRNLIKLLQTKDPSLNVEFLVVEKDTSIVAMELTSDVCDHEKLMRAFKKPNRTTQAKGGA